MQQRVRRWWYRRERTTAKSGSQTVFVMGSQTYSTPNATAIGAAYTAILE